MGELLKTWYGLTLFILFDAAAILAVLTIGYKFLFKRLFDILIGAVCIVALSPLFLAIVIRGKLFIKQQDKIAAEQSNGESGDSDGKKTAGIRSLIGSEFCVGKKAKAIKSHFFVTETDEGKVAGKYGAWLRRTGFDKLPRLFDVLAGGFSVIGVKPLSLTDAAFVSESDEGRYAVRPGLINPLVRARTGGTENGGETDYAEMFVSDLRYARKVSLLMDVGIFLSRLLKAARGVKNESWLGETAKKTYAESLIEKGEITREDFETVKSNADLEEKELLGEQDDESDSPDGSNETEQADDSDERDGSDELDSLDGSDKQ